MADVSPSESDQRGIVPSAAAGDAPPPTSPAARLASIDAYRGLVMFLMMAEVLQLRMVARALPDSSVWALLAGLQTHVDWVGCSLHDLIQPSFSLLVGVALPFSIASRSRRGQSFLRMTIHAWWRALLLVALGIVLRSLAALHVNFTFEDTLTQIGLGYGLLFFLGFRPAREQWIAVLLILVGYWAAFALYPLPGNDFSYQSVGVSAAWLQEQGLAGFAAHWNKNSNFGWAFDTWFLNLFPRPKPFVFNGGGYPTLSFIPTLATMILGLTAGGVLRGPRSAWAKVRWLALVGLATLAAGWLLAWLGVCPVVKRLWTPSWALYSGGWCFLLLAGSYAVLDIGRRRSWAFPLIVIGMNSITAYCMANLFEGFISAALKRHFGVQLFAASGQPYQPLMLGACVLLVQWCILWAMYRKRVFLRV